MTLGNRMTDRAEMQGAAASVEDWLLRGPAWVRYRAMLDLGIEDGGAAAARLDVLRDAQVQALIAGLADWPGEVLNSHRSASQPYHRLNFLADLGLRADDPGMAVIVERIFEHASAEGPFQLPLNISKGHGGTGEDTWAWALCDAPLLVYALTRLGLGDHPLVQRAAQHLLSLVRENGWPCAVSPELGGFRGPGRSSDPCPYANLAMLKMLGQFTELRECWPAVAGVETLLGLWERRRSEHPYIFYMGTDFCKLKAPLVWYDLLHVLDTLAMFPGVGADPRFADMLRNLQEKQDGEGRFTAESVYTAWKEWEFGQKKTPSRWITLIARRVIRRSAGNPLG